MVVWPPPEERGASNPNARLIIIAAVAAVVILVVGAVGVSLVLAAKRSSQSTAAAPSATHSPGPVGPTTQLTATSGTSIFSDDFHDSNSGWDTVANSADADYAYSSGTYVVTAKRDFYYYEPSPYSEPKRQISASVTATLDVHTPPDAGFGVDCFRGAGSALVSYEFTADADANWYVQRAIGDTSTAVPSTLAKGSLGSAPAPGVLPVTLVGVCATASDGVTTRLVLFVDGRKVADLTDAASESSDQGWRCDLLTAGSATRPVTETVTHFEERDLSRSGP
jgi:hypothetical protein